MYKYRMSKLFVPITEIWFHTIQHLCGRRTKQISQPGTYSILRNSIASNWLTPDIIESNEETF